jgi:uncharacterized membrane protein YhaH (DUF805 family)
MTDLSNDTQRPRTLGSAVAICLNRYFQISDRAPRSKYWYFLLFAGVAAFAAGIVDLFVDPRYEVFGTFVDLALFLPMITVSVRRLHDIDRSGWWLLLAFVPLFGPIIVFIWSIIAGTRGANRYGPDPLGGPVAGAAAAAA